MKEIYDYQMKCPKCNNTIRKDSYECVYCSYELGSDFDEIDKVGMSDRIIYFCIGAAVGCASTCLWALFILV